jgi:energy-coupling factor transport system ATP-binding protein
MSSAVLELENVSFGYPGADILSGISFKIEPGGMTALLGENGAGKSTLCRLCNGLLSPTSGRVLVRGRDTSETKTSAIARDAGFLFQNPDRQICRNTVREEIMFGLSFVLEDESLIEKRCEETMELFGLDGGRIIFEMSRGERQRTALASVLARKPRLLILDEPTTNLDYRECMKIMDIIMNLRNDGTAVLMITHDMEIVIDCAPRALVLGGGRLIYDGPVKPMMRDMDFMRGASLLPAQIPSLAISLGAGFEDVFYVADMADAAEARRNVRDI